MSCIYYNTSVVPGRACVLAPKLKRFSPGVVIVGVPGQVMERNVEPEERVFMICYDYWQQVVQYVHCSTTVRRHVDINKVEWGVP